MQMSTVSPWPDPSASNSKTSSSPVYLWHTSTTTATASQRSSDQLRPEGEQLLKALVPPLQVYLGERDEMLMVSGFTDNVPVPRHNGQFQDNLELSAQRALTVTRTLVREGMPRARVFSAAFGAEQPVASNADEKGRPLNRRVEMAPVPRASAAVTGKP